MSDVAAQGQVDLGNMAPYSNHNNGRQHILMVIDIVCKYAWAGSLKNKIGEEVAKVFKAIFRQKLQTDRG